MLRVGIAGIGFMGMIHYLAYQQVPGVAVRGICSRSEQKRKGDWRGIQGNFGPQGEQMDLSGVSAFAEVDEMLADPELDLIDITLPPHQHARVTEAALRAGKHVFCEKPLTLDAASSLDLVSLANAQGKQLLVGHVLPFFPEYQWARDVIASGTYGKVRGGHFRRVVSDPAWLKDYWNPSLVGGPMLDLHVHDAHFIRLLFGMPSSVTTAGRMRGPCAEAWTTLFRYSDRELAVSASSGTIGQQGRPFLHGFEISLESATLLFEFAVIGKEGKYTSPPVLLGPEGDVVQPELGNGDPMLAFVRQLTEVVHSVQRGQTSRILSGVLAADAITLCHLQTQSLMSGERVSVSATDK